MRLKFLVHIALQFVLGNIVTAHVHLHWYPTHPAFDPAIYEEALDPELCREQLRFITNNNAVLRLKFLEAGMRLPKGLTEFNNIDMGYYDQCIDIHEPIDDSVIEGKFCMIEGPVSRDVADYMNWSDFDPTFYNNETLERLNEIEGLKSKLAAIAIGADVSRTLPILPALNLPTFRMALCVPKTCTTQEGLSGLLFNLTMLGFRYREEFCRFKGDKPWAPADYVAIAIFSFIGLLTILSTGYDLHHTFFLKKDPQETSPLLKSFSVYTNGKRLTSFSYNPNNLNSVDGIRAISMFWIVVGHTYLLLPHTINVRYVYFEWILSLNSLWITAAPYTVDTFFFLSGLLVVYTTAGKLSGSKLIRNIHLFYLNRLLRMFPLLAAIVLLQASLFHHIADGPFWQWNAWNTNNCRTYWWSTLLYVQNFLNPADQCINHTWYLAIDMHCYLVCPLFLYWVLNGNKKHAWISLAAGLLIALTIGTTYSFIHQFQGWSIAPVREGGSDEFQHLYYFNTLTRASPFFVGMIFGYLMNIWKGRKPNIPRYVTALLWICSGILVFGLIYVTHLMKLEGWDYWIVDDLVNSFARSAWAAVVGWVIFACQHGLSGPINWFLCLDFWKMPSRISYAMYLYHFHLQFILTGTARAPIFFSDGVAIYHFFSQVLMTYGISFFLTLILDSPFSILFKVLLGSGAKKPKKEIPDKE
ncbi:nose resistant to fluoxetine protein 6-like [Pectinophora gossypiella]|uniref:nose resistant to fluoxetine protein 6-like n=1 Tax=Pectinophora gossypiella TaxID=13191 RepID=UPI00214E9043|nr:nose resistant to fluoxetine protein 6-like [Pectinophora gossypiella]